MKTINLISISLILLLFPLLGRAATDPGWSCDIHAYQYDMSIYFSLRQNDKLLTGDKVIAAFCEEECRGIAELQSNNSVSYYYLRVRSNQETGDSIYFRVFDRDANKELPTSGSLSFENLKQTGYPSQPWVLTLPVLIEPGESGGLDQVTETTEVLQLDGQWTSEDLNKLSENIHKEENGELINIRLSSVDMSKAILEENVSLNGVFAGCSSLTSVKLPDLSSLKKESPEAFSNTNPNCIVFVPNNVNIPAQWFNDVNIVVNGIVEQLILKENKPFRTPQAFKAKQAVYQYTTSSLKSAYLKSAALTGWETICLPFPVRAVNIEADDALSPVSTSGNTCSGDFYIATLTDRGFELITDRKESEPYLYANTPYLLNMTSSEGNDIEGIVRFSSKGEVAIGISEPSHILERSEYDLIGVFEPVSITEGIYGLDENGNSFINNGSDILPFKAYLHPKVTPLPSSIPVRMYAAVTGIQITSQSVSVEVGKTVTLIASVLPENATNPKVQWSSSDDNIVTVSSQGVVKGVKEGTVVITAKTEDGGFTATSSVTVTKSSIPPIPEVKVTGVTISPDSYVLNVNETIQLSAIVQPSDASNKKVIWSSSDASVASVSATGLVLGLKTGHITVSAKTEDGGFKADSQITINNLPTSIEESDAKSIRIHPTVVSSSFTLSGLQSEGLVELYSYTGQAVKILKATTSSFLVNISDLQTGHYIVKITENNQTYIFKIHKR